MKKQFFRSVPKKKIYIHLGIKAAYIVSTDTPQDVPISE